MWLSTASLVVLMAMSAAAKNDRTYAINYFYGKGPLTVGRMDPIVSPGKASAHHHTIMGGSNFGIDMTDTQLLSSTCTNANIKDDKSSYWVPSLFFQDPNDGTFTPVPMFYSKVYYYFEATDDPIKAFEPGLRIVVGNPSLRTPPSTGGDSILDPARGPVNPVQWICPRQDESTPLYEPNSDGLHGVGVQDSGNKGAGAGFPDKECDLNASPLRADIHFPSCYNPAAGLDAYQTNMQFPSSKIGTSGKANCPPGWIHTPHIFMEVYWNTPLFHSKWTQGQGKQPFVLANGDPTGYSLHADFISGWSPDVLQKFIDTCNAGQSGLQACPGVLPSDINDPNTSCNIPAAVPDDFVIDESLTVKLAKLPGNNPIVGFGGSPAAPPAGGPVSSSPPAAVSSLTARVSAPAPTPSAPAQRALAAQPSAQTYNVTSPPSNTAQQIPSANSQVGAVSSSTVNPNRPATPVTIPPVAPGPPVKTVTAPSTYNSPVVPFGNGSISGWDRHGCHSDILNSRVLSGITLANIGNHQVTNTKCTAYCGANGYSLAGTEFGGQCFCGNTLVGSSQLADSKCNMPCEGDITETCGGSLALTVYKKSTHKDRKKRHLASHAEKHRVARPLNV